MTVWGYACLTVLFVRDRGEALGGCKRHDRLIAIMAEGWGALRRHAQGACAPVGCRGGRPRGASAGVVEDDFAEDGAAGQLLEGQARIGEGKYLIHDGAKALVEQLEQRRQLGGGPH